MGDWVGRYVRSIVDFKLPFFGPGLLVVLDDGTPDVVKVLKELTSRAPAGLEIVCVRSSELWQLAVPDPYVVQTFAMPFWIREEGHVRFGEDVRHRVPMFRNAHRLLANHIEISLHRVRNHVILSCLASGQYAQLSFQLARERSLLMSTALMAQDIWRVWPETVRRQFQEAYPDPALNSLLAALDDVPNWDAERATARASAFRSVWYHERFVTELRSYSV